MGDTEKLSSMLSVTARKWYSQNLIPGRLVLSESHVNTGTLWLAHSKCSGENSSLLYLKLEYTEAKRPTKQQLTILTDNGTPPSKLFSPAQSSQISLDYMLFLWGRSCSFISSVPFHILFLPWLSNELLFKLQSPAQMSLPLCTILSFPYLSLAKTPLFTSSSSRAGTPLWSHQAYSCGSVSSRVCLNPPALTSTPMHWLVLNGKGLAWIVLVAGCVCHVLQPPNYTVFPLFKVLGFFCI